MEFLALIAIYFVLKLLFSGGGSAGPNMGAMELRFTDARLGEDNDGLPFKAIEAKGLFPLNKTRRIGFVTSVIDDTGDEPEAVICPLEFFQEPESIAYQHTSEIGQVSPDHGFTTWVRVGAVVPELLSSPYGGRRKFIAIMRLVDLDDMPEITHGFQSTDDTRILWYQELKFEHTVVEKGYLEAAEHRDEAKGLSVQIGMAVAMADGSLDDREGKILKEWITKEISPFPDDKREKLKNLYNESMTRAYEAAKSGDLSLSDLTEKLNEIAEKSTRYETIELCFDVMAADGVVEAEEIRVIRKVSEALDLNFDEIEKMRDQKIIGLDTDLSHQAPIEEILGIEPDWDTDRIKKHLRTEFQKWNNRLNALAEGEERDNAQRMLDLVSEARKKYG
ncbi:MAG: TerB family tellurite resistance protein [Alphaproteobacteria bacterium]|nr:TerB family tellurite resistance protein [Alphaproteobacteria bacterium]